MSDNKCFLVFNVFNEESLINIIECFGLFIIWEGIENVDWVSVIIFYIEVCMFYEEEFKCLVDYVCLIKLLGVDW